MYGSRATGKNMNCMWMDSAWDGVHRRHNLAQFSTKLAVALMKEAKFVHGDLWLPNVVIRNGEIQSDTPTPIILDFEWAGPQGQAKYPTSPTPYLRWPLGVNPGVCIVHSHDGCQYFSTIIDFNWLCKWFRACVCHGERFICLTAIFIALMKPTNPQVSQSKLLLIKRVSTWMGASKAAPIPFKAGFWRDKSSMGFTVPV